MSPRNFQTSNPASDLDTTFDEILRRIANLEAGRHRGAGSSFGAPFLLKSGNITYSIGIDTSNRLTATCLNTGVVTVIALP